MRTFDVICDPSLDFAITSSMSRTRSASIIGGGPSQRAVPPLASGPAALSMSKADLFFGERCQRNRTFAISPIPQILRTTAILILGSVCLSPFRADKR